jgi:hypothetical protein
MMMDNRAINYVLSNSSTFQKPQTLRRNVGQLFGQGMHTLQLFDDQILMFCIIGILFAEGALIFGDTMTCVVFMTILHCYR